MDTFTVQVQIPCPCHLLMCAGLVCLLLGIVLGALGRLLDHPVYGPFVQSLHASFETSLLHQCGPSVTNHIGLPVRQPDTDTELFFSRC